MTALDLNFFHGEPCFPGICRHIQQLRNEEFGWIFRIDGIPTCRGVAFHCQTLGGHFYFPLRFLIRFERITLKTIVSGLMSNCGAR